MRFRRSLSRTFCNSKSGEAKFVLHVEKDTVWGADLNEGSDYWEKHNCILTEGSGHAAARPWRRLLRRLNEETWPCRIYCLLDCDPWGHYIYKASSSREAFPLAFESERLANPRRPATSGIRAKELRGV